MLCVLVLGRDTWGYYVTDMASGTYWPLSVTVADTQLMTTVSLSLQSSPLSGTLPLHQKPCICCGVAALSASGDHEQPVPSHGSLPASALSTPVYAVFFFFFWSVPPFYRGGDAHRKMKGPQSLNLG